MSFVGLIRRSFGNLHKSASFQHTSRLCTRLDANCQQRILSDIRRYHHQIEPISPAKDNLKLPKTQQDREYHSSLEIKELSTTIEAPNAVQDDPLAPSSNQWQRLKDCLKSRENALSEAPIPEKKHRWVLWIMLGINTSVWVCFCYGIGTVIEDQNRKPLHFMLDNFTFSLRSVLEGRVWTLFTNCVAHLTYDHIIDNMITLYFIGRPLLALLGPTTFSALYFGTSAVSNLASLSWAYLHRRFFCPNEDDIIGPQREPVSMSANLGASGSNYALLTSLFLLAPFTRFKLLWWIPTPIWVITGYFYAVDTYEILTDPAGQVDHGGHLGGILSGFLFWRFRLKGMRYRSLAK